MRCLKVPVWNLHFPAIHFGHTELIIVLVVPFILFGHRLPGIMRDLGRPQGPWN